MVPFFWIGVWQFPRAEDVLSILLRTEHNGFPVLYPPELIDRYPELGNFAGIINRKHLCVLLSHRALSPHRPELPTVDQLAGTGYATGNSFGAEAQIRKRRPSFMRRRASMLRARVLSFTEQMDEAQLTHKDMEGQFPRFPAAHTIQLRPED